MTNKVICDSTSLLKNNLLHVGNVGNNINRLSVYVDNSRNSRKSRKEQGGSWNQRINENLYVTDGQHDLTGVATALKVTY